tara:strand:- start:186 stop:491 length:306 start_codon:yes stop_codon:yes gene_type:complete
MAGMGMQFLFAGTEKNDPTKLHTIIKFESIEAMQAFGADKELTETHKQARCGYRERCHNRNIRRVLHESSRCFHAALDCESKQNVPLVSLIAFTKRLNDNA